MSRRTKGRAEENPRPDTEVAATISAIAGLRRRLRRLGAIDHPAFRRELRKLEELLASLFEQAGRTGRHRSPGSKTPGRLASDGEADLKPDPATAATSAEYITVLWRYRAWHGDPSWRKMAADARHTVVHSTIYAAMHGRDLPTLDVVKAVILGCGGSQDDLDAFTSAWHRIHDGTGSGHDTPRPLPAPVPELQLTTTP